jgi:uncharacterized protein YukE
MVGALTMPSGDPNLLEQLASRLEAAATGAEDLGASSREVTAAVRSDAQWTGDAADAYTAFTGDLSAGAAAVDAPLSRIALAVRNYAGYLRTAQQKASAYNSAAEAAQASGDDPGYVSAAAAAAQDAESATAAWQAAGDHAVAEVNAAVGELEESFGAQGPVQSWLNRQSWETLSTLAGPEFPGAEGYLLPPDLPGSDGDPLPPELPEPEGDPIPPEIPLPRDPIPPELPGFEGDPIPPELPVPQGDPIPPLWPLLNKEENPEDGNEDEPESGQGPESTETIHSTLRGGAGERDIDPTEVIGNAENIYYDENGNQIYVWSQPGGMNQITIRDPASGNIVTNQESSDSWVQAQLDGGRWYSLG